ncbi:f-box domain protein, cyclin-like protein [Sporothrix schenckii 1099-18]|uniref:F-box domain protein, cyclin-like protein n=1 Tax=Sporothrix schenckii 1099-18 TaxID=1397361 RepID=A0A0F2M5J8_SPOSC|nr:f-box domain protein, cyclin-like protein [Sporothrix schenckii 1099-18]KJR83446.1 f-box domain protein, cyclin-like protein [Sporothrix schenckii 1099-18]
MILLSDLPLEVGTAILSYVSPLDLLSVSLASKSMQSYVQGNSQLHRLVYCNYFDKPARSDINWERELVDFRRLRSICHSKSTSKETELDLVARLVKQYLGVACETTKGGFDLSTRTHRNARRLARLIKGRCNYEAFFCRSFLYDRIRNTAAAAGLPSASTSRPVAALTFPATPQAHHQTSAELHCLLGAVLLKYVVASDRAADAYPFAVSKVYDMREYTRASLWGPFMADGSGRVDWEKVEAIMIVLRANILRKGFLRYGVVAAYWNSTFQGSSPGSYRPLVANAHMDALPDDTVPLDAEDPYGVTGTWMRLVSFLDYSDFFRFNFPDEDDQPNNVPVPDDVPRPPFLSEEELRLIVMEIHVTRIEWRDGRPQPDEEADSAGQRASSPAADDGMYDNTHPDFPVVHFHGMSHSVDSPWDDNANSGLYGTVRTTKEGHVRWTTFSTFDGHPRWRSEGIQVGGRRSGRGVLGNWFDAGFDRRGPCGPTAFWKVHAKKVEPLPASPPGFNGFPFGGTVPSFMYLLHSTNALNSATWSRPAGQGAAAGTSGPTTRSMTAAAANNDNHDHDNNNDDDDDDDDGVFDGASEDDQQPVSFLPAFQEPRHLYTYLELPLGAYVEAQFQIVDELGGNLAMWDSEEEEEEEEHPFAV